MKERIKLFIDYKGLPAGELARLMEVQRSNISHILNGRNKPGAGFIEKFLLLFPELNARWLLTGKGSMLNQTDSQQNTSTKDSDKIHTPSYIHSNKPDEASDNSSEKNETSDFPPPVPGISAKRIEKVILFYSDGTFISYNPD